MYICMVEGKETLDGHFLPKAADTAPSLNGMAVASTFIVGGSDGSDDT